MLDIKKINILKESALVYIKSPTFIMDMLNLTAYIILYFMYCPYEFYVLALEEHDHSYNRYIKKINGWDKNKYILMFKYV